MRRATAVFLVALGVLLAAAPAALAKRALIAFLPTQPAPKMPLLFDLQERNFAYGVMSPTLGAYTKRQMLFDITQGTRIANNAYGSTLGLVELQYGLGRQNRMVGWFYDARRAEKAPGDVLPGLLGASLGAHELRVAYAGVIGFEQTEAISSAGRRGGVGPVSLGTAGTFAKRTLGLWQRNQVVFARFPGDEQGLEALDQIVAARRPDDLIVVVRAPPPGGTKLLPTGILGPGFAGDVLYSDTTRRVGYVAATDLAPTILHYFGIKVPKQMQGRIVTARSDGDAEAVRARMARLDVVLGRRNPAIRTWALCTLGLFAALWLTLRRPGLRLAARIAFLAVLWLPGCCLVTAAIAPSRRVELLGLALGSLALGALTDRLVRWPLAPVVPAAIVFGAHAVDLARGSPLIGASLAGPNPKGGARFFGIGNELEIWLSLEVLLGLGAALCLAPRRWLPRAFAVGCLVAAAIMGSGRLGADVGAVITLGAGGAGAVLASLERRPSARAIVIACLVPVVAIGALIGLDLITSGGAHLTRTVVHGSFSDNLDTLRRRFTISVKGFKQTEIAVLVALGVVAFAYALRRRAAVMAPVREYPAWSAALWGGLSATVIGSISNDSGPLMFALGSIIMVLAAGYVHGGPRVAEESSRPTRAPSPAPAAAR